MQQVFATHGQCVPTEPSVGALLEEVAGLADEVRGRNQRHPLLQMWAVDSDARALAYKSAQEVYGLPNVAEEEREKPQGLIFFWSRIRDLFEAALSSPAPLTVEARPYDPLSQLPCHRGDFAPHEGSYHPEKMYPLKNA